MNGSVRHFGWVLLVLLVAGCATPQHLVHHTLRDSPEARPPRKLVLLPLDITVSEFTAAGGVEKDPDWSQKAAAAVEEVVHECTRDCSLELVPLPELAAGDKAMLEEHLALFDVVGASAITHTRGVEPLRWPAKLEKFDYTLGPGLRFLAEKSGADGALVVLGQDYVSSPGRKVMFILAAAGGVAIPLGHSWLVFGLVDLRTGDLLWLNRSVSETVSLRDHTQVKTMVANLLQSYPGVQGSQ